MKNLSSWLITMFAFMFWGFRVFGTVMYYTGREFMFAPTDPTMEVTLLFITFICVCLIVKRLMFASMVYLFVHLVYYGPQLLSGLTSIMDGTIQVVDTMSVFFCLIGVALPIAAVFDVLLDKNRKAHPVDKKTDWYYKGKQYDREMDERADKNNYRTM